MPSVSPACQMHPSSSLVPFTFMSHGSPCNLIHTIPFMGHKANDTRLFCSILFICHFYSSALCSPYLSMHDLSQIETAIEMEIIPDSHWLKGNNFLLFEAYLSCSLFLRESYGCVALFTKVFNINIEFRWICAPWSRSATINLSTHAKTGRIWLEKWVWSWQKCTLGFEILS